MSAIATKLQKFDSQDSRQESEQENSIWSCKHGINKGYCAICNALSEQESAALNIYKKVAFRRDKPPTSIKNAEKQSSRIYSGEGRGLRFKPPSFDLNERITPILKAVDLQLGNQWSNFEKGICFQVPIYGFQERAKYKVKAKVISKKDISGFQKKPIKRKVIAKSLASIREDVDGILGIDIKIKKSIKKGIRYAIAGMDYEPSESGDYFAEQHSGSNAEEESEKEKSADEQKIARNFAQREG